MYRHCLPGAYWRWFALLMVGFVPRLSYALNVDSLPWNFTLAAYNNTLPNANLTGAPLVLGFGGASTGVSFECTATYASYPYDEYPSLALIAGTLRAFTPSGEWLTNASEVYAGGLLSWVTTRMPGYPPPNPFTAVSLPESKLRILAAHGYANMWSLCPSYAFRGQDRVVYNVSEDARPQAVGYNPKDCYSVTINIVPILE